MAIFSIRGNDVFRYSSKIAEISKTDEGFAWEGFGMRREGFASVEKILADVRYFYRYGARPSIATLNSGRKVFL